MTAGVVFNFSDDPTSIPDGAALSADPLVAEAAGTPTLASYGRAVWPTVSDLSLAWRRSGSGLPAVRAAGLSDAMWWAAVDGSFEARGGVVDTLYRALVIDAVLADCSGPVVALGTEGDPWLSAAAAVCDARSRDLVIRTIAPAAPTGTNAPSVVRRAGLLLRRTAGIAPRRVGHAELLVVLAHGRMARTTGAGRIADVYTRDFLDPLATRIRTAFISLEAPARGMVADLAAIVGATYRPWIAWCSLAELRATGGRREAWARTVREADVFALTAAGIDLSPAVVARAVPMAARGLSVAELYAAAFRRALDDIGPRAVLSTEGHSNVGRVLGALAPTTSLIAPQAGVIGRDGVTNAAYDHRGLEPLSDDGRTGCPVPSRSLLWGAHYRELLRTLGHQVDSLRVTGLPRDVPAYAGTGDEVLFVAGANDDVCAFASSFSEEIVTIRAVVRATDRRVRVRLHPTHRLARYRAALGSSVELADPSARTLADDLSAAQVVIGKSSTALIEAAAGGWPILIVNLGPTPDLTGFGDAGLPLAEEPEALASAIASAAPASAAAAALAGTHGDDAIAETVENVAGLVAP